MMIDLTGREIEIINLALDAMAVGDTSDYGIDYDEEVVPLTDKLENK